MFEIEVYVGLRMHQGDSTTRGQQAAGQIKFWCVDCSTPMHEDIATYV